MNILVADQISKSFGADTLFEGVCFGINDGDKCGLIGVNGTGKSTLLKILAGLEESDSGTITKRTGLKIAYLPQTPEFDDAMSVLQNVIYGKKADTEYRNLEGEARADLLKLGIENPDAVPSTLSGGQRKRAALVRTLLTDSELLILDEPTNHLDAAMTEWLEETLKKYRGAFICITHDRYFLDEVTNKIFELDKGKLYSYVANYSRFVELKAEREEMELATERKAKTLFKQELAWMLRGARARTTKQKAHIQRFEALRDRDKIVETENVEMFSAFSRLGKKTLEACNLHKEYSGKTVVSDFSYMFLQNDRIGIIGPNGCGKSTLVKMLTGQLQPDSGHVDYGITVKFGYFAQECSFADTSVRVIDYVRDIAEVIYTKEGPITASKMCERFLFNADKQYAPVSKLSGGEKRRLYLLKVLMEAPNVLILDEPTNDLDIMTLTILEDYLAGFEGIIITVSHDRYFLDKLVNRIFYFAEDGSIRRSEGNYTDYRNRILDEEDEKKQNSDVNSGSKANGPVSGNAGASNAKSYRDNAPKKLRFTYNEQKEFDTIDEVIAGLEDKIGTLDAEIEASGTDYQRLNELMTEKEKTEKLLEEKMDRWMYLTELAEKIEAQ